MVLNSEKLNNRCPNLQVVGSTHSPFVLVGAEKTAAFNLETGEMHEHLESRGSRRLRRGCLGWNKIEAMGLIGEIRESLPDDSD